jgi:hypothetical protein
MERIVERVGGIKLREGTESMCAPRRKAPAEADALEFLEPGRWLLLLFLGLVGVVDGGVELGDDLLDLG